MSVLNPKTASYLYNKYWEDYFPDVNENCINLIKLGIETNHRIILFDNLGVEIIFHNR